MMVTLRNDGDAFHWGAFPAVQRFGREGMGAGAALSSWIMHDRERTGLIVPLVQAAPKDRSCQRRRGPSRAARGMKSQKLLRCSGRWGFYMGHSSWTTFTPCFYSSDCCHCNTAAAATFNTGHLLVVGCVQEKIILFARHGRNGHSAPLFAKMSSHNNIWMRQLKWKENSLEFSGAHCSPAANFFQFWHLLHIWYNEGKQKPTQGKTNPSFFSAFLERWISVM